MIGCFLDNLIKCKVLKPWMDVSIPWFFYVLNKGKLKYG